MNAHVLERLPLWVEGDLEAPEASAVQSHLEGCPACRAAAEALRESQAWVRTVDPAPFSPAERLALRASVLTQIRQEGRPSRIRALRPYVLAAAAVLVLLVTTRFRSTPSVSAPETSRPATITPTHVPAATTLQASPRPVRIAHRKPAPDPDPIPAGSSLSRIELQTSNPQIRIIWLAKCEPAPEPTPDPTEPSTEVP